MLCCFCILEIGVKIASITWDTGDKWGDACKVLSVAPSMQHTQQGLKVWMRRLAILDCPSRKGIPLPAPGMQEFFSTPSELSFKMLICPEGNVSPLASSHSSLSIYWNFVWTFTYEISGPLVTDSYPALSYRGTSHMKWPEGTDSVEEALACSGGPSASSIACPCAS